MLRTYCFRAKDSSSDRGEATITIVTESLMECRRQIKKLLKEKNRPDLDGKFQCLSCRDYLSGIVLENVEPGVTDGIRIHSEENVKRASQLDDG